MAKYYKFSGTKHAHDIEFRRNRAFNNLMDEYSKHGENTDTAAALESLITRLDELRGYLHEGVCEIPAHLYGLALECVAWAAAHRN